MSKKDALADALLTYEPPPPKSALGKIETYFGDRPEVLEAIRVARVERGLSHRQISEVLSQAGKPISKNAVAHSLEKQGIK